MKHSRIAFGSAVAAAAAAALLAGAAAAATQQVEVSDNQFTPKTRNATVGDSVHWSRAAGSVNFHNIEAKGKFFDSGEPTAGAINLTKTFSSGTFPYECEVHGDSGMRGKVRVPVLVHPNHQGNKPLVKWAGSSTNTGSKFDVQFKVGTGDWRNWKTNTESGQAVFGKDGKPVEVKTGKVYRFRARSQKEGAQSAWSPQGVIET
jgi:plastocyanin